MRNSLKLIVSTSVTLGVLATGFALAPLALAQKQVASAMPPEPVSKVSPVKAMKIAEDKTGGKATLAMFEFDEGHWVYGVVIVKNHKLSEVEIDPVTGKVGDVEDVTPDGEAKEFADELSKMTK